MIILPKDDYYVVLISCIWPLLKRNIENGDGGFLEMERADSEEKIGQCMDLFPRYRKFRNRNRKEYGCAIKQISWRRVEQSSGFKNIIIKTITIIKLHRINIFL